MRYVKISMAMVTLLFVILSGMQADAGGRSKKIVAPIPQTGQTISDAEGDDGDLQMGVPWPDRRFSDKGDGTVRDNLTGLIWLKNANCFGVRSWADALNDCNILASGSCGLTDASEAGDWRLPNVKELHSLVDYGATNPALPPNNWFVNVQSNENGPFYWTSTTYYAYPWAAWWLDFCHGHVIGAGYKDNSHQGMSHYYVWPVRDAQ
jgi:Protein of unknown function (DUF1566)